MSATTDALAAAAQAATDLADEWRESAERPDAGADWVAHCALEERRALDRAAWYLERAALLETPIPTVRLKEPIFYV